MYSEHDRNVVPVKIFGQEYSISGTAPREHIMKVADYVDGKMAEISASFSGSPSAIAVLAAVNAADEYFRNIQEIEDLRRQNQQLEKDAHHYVQLWDEVKLNFAQYKEEMAKNVEQKEAAQREFQAREKEISRLISELADARNHNEVLRSRVEELLELKESAGSEEEEKDRLINELENKCRDIESSFFDIQMENIHLKNELEALKKRL